jgi:hypothetical protein
MWVRIDEKNIIRERMAVKKCAPSSALWNCPDEWRNRLPREVRMHQLIDSTRPASSPQNLISHRSHRMMMTKKRYRLYLDVCDGGRLVENLRPCFKSHPWRYAVPLSPSEIPESFVWHVFGGLVDACLVLEQGRLEERVEGWRPLVHNDMHSSNVLLERDPDDGMVSDTLKAH